MQDTYAPERQAAAFEAVAGARNPNLLLLCDHASNALPPGWGSLGLSQGQLKEHIAWDIGAAAVTRHLARLLGAPALLSRYSRLFIDCNRALGTPNSIPEESDGVGVPANRALTAAEMARRADIAFHPYHRELARRLDSLGDPFVIAVHSCTAVFAGQARPWHVGVLWRRDAASAGRLIAALARDKALHVGDNQPYSAFDAPGHTVADVVEPRKLRHVIIEIRQDLIAGDAGAEAWAERLADLLTREFALVEAQS
ncbi:MAG: N-formylglutamate amidohydrolase [Alphaproteobacteria bacterium]|nr:N-formylglutamate amidohydrolase [Alphaproteobacteria bacterium]MDP6643199.1 N-formylglutamate amidohydrolase [Rhodospirillales bacterium]MDP6817349.1 N-formylglutamate amidohydrolase [Alphaproteobacteria bacterium]